MGCAWFGVLIGLFEIPLIVVDCIQRFMSLVNMQIIMHTKLFDGALTGAAPDAAAMQCRSCNIATSISYA